MDAKEAAETLSKCHGEFVPTKEFQQKLFDAGIVVVVPPFDDEWWGDEVRFHGRLASSTTASTTIAIQNTATSSVTLIDLWTAHSIGSSSTMYTILWPLNSGPGVVLMHVEGKEELRLRLSASFPHESFRVKGSRNTGIAFNIEDAIKEPA